MNASDPSANLASRIASSLNALSAAKSGALRVTRGRKSTDT